MAKSGFPDCARVARCEVVLSKILAVAALSMARSMLPMSAPSWRRKATSDYRHRPRRRSKGCLSLRPWPRLPPTFALRLRAKGWCMFVACRPHLNMARSYIAPPFREAPFPRVLCHGCLRRVVGYLGVLDPDGLRVYKGVRTEV